MYKPFVQSKQFPVAWDMGRKTRLGPQMYLLEATEKSQIQLLIFLSQYDNLAWNIGNIVPAVTPENNSLIYSTILYTCPESTNLGLTASNINLQMIAKPGISGQTVDILQDQIWHRVNTSLIGDTIQVGFTMSDDQMFDETISNQFAEIIIHGFILDVSPSMVLA